jgi:hypothetical protein
MNLKSTFGLDLDAARLTHEVSHHVKVRSNIGVLTYLTIHEFSLLASLEGTCLEHHVVHEAKGSVDASILLRGSFGGRKGTSVVPTVLAEMKALTQFATVVTGLGV